MSPFGVLPAEFLPPRAGDSGEGRRNMSLPGASAGSWGGLVGSGKGRLGEWLM